MKHIFLRLTLAVIFLSCVATLADAQTIRTRAYLHTRFETGDFPTQTDYRDWMASYWHQTEDSITITSLVGVDELSNDVALADSSSRALVTEAAVKAYVDAVGAGSSLTDGDKGDITVSGGATVWNIDTDAVGSAEIATGAVGTSEIANGSVANADLATMPANTIKGNNTAGAISPVDLTTAQVKTLLDIQTTDLSDFAEAVEDKIGTKVVAGGGITVAYDDGTGETTISGTGLSDGDKGDIDVTSSGATWTLDTAAVTTVKIADDAVTLAKQASGTANRLQGFDASGNPSEISAGTGITISAGLVSSSGGFTMPQIRDSLATYINVREFGALGDNSDQTTKIQAALATGQDVYIPAGRYIISDTLFLASGQSIWGDGYKTVLKTTGTTLPILAIFTKINCGVKDIRFVGSYAGSNLTNQIGIFIDGVTSYTASEGHRIEGCYFDSLGTFGLRVQSSFGTSGYDGGLISGCKANYCHTGFYLAGRAEYIMMTNSSAKLCNTGAFISGGNNNLTNCNFSGNAIGLKLDNATNHLHGNFSDLTINHCSTSGISATNTTLAQRFDNLHMWYADINIQNCNDFTFSNCTFSNDSIIVANSDSIWFDGCDFVSGMVKNISTSTVYFVNSVGEGGFDAGKYPIADGDYNLNVASGVHSWTLNTGGTTYTASRGIGLVGTDFRLGGTNLAETTFADTRKINLSGNSLYIGDSSDSTLFRLNGASDMVAIDNPTSQVATLGIKAKNATTPTAEFQNNSGVTGVSVYGDGSLMFGTTASFYTTTFKPAIFARDPFNLTTTTNLGQLGLGYRSSGSGVGHLFVGLSSNTSTSGTTNAILGASQTFAPTSSTAEWSTVLAYPTVNQTGTASGITAGYRTIPTLTAAADFRHYLAKSPTATAATISTSFYSRPQKVSGVTTGYGFYQEGTSDINRFDGEIRDSTGSAGTAGQFPVSTGAGWSWKSTSTALDANYFKQGGNSFGAAATIGTNDANALNLETNNTTYATLSSGGGFSLTNSRLSVNGSGAMDATAAAQITLSNTSASQFAKLQVDDSGDFNISTVSSETQLKVKNLGGTEVTGYFMCTPMTAASASAITPANGMIVYVSDTNGTFTSVGFWGYENGAWTKL